MENIKTLLSSNRILFNDEIVILLKEIFKVFGLQGEPILKIDSKIDWVMLFNSSEPYTFRLNWKMLENSIKKMPIKELNYWICFYCFHEVVHLRQFMSDITDDEVVNKIFMKNYVYIEQIKSSRITFMLKGAMYRMYHDYFPIEINADVIAYIKILEILKEIDLEYYEKFLNFFQRRIEKVYEDDKLKDIYTVLLDVNVNLDDYSIEERIIYGMPIEKSLNKKIDIYQLIK